MVCGSLRVFPDDVCVGGVSVLGGDSCYLPCFGSGVSNDI